MSGVLHFFQHLLDPNTPISSLITVVALVALLVAGMAVYATTVAIKALTKRR